MKVFFTASTSARQDVVWRPAVDVYKTREGWLLKFDLAGVRMEDMQVSLEGRRLIVKGVRRDYLVEDGCSYYSMEISYNRFERVVELPVALGRSDVRLNYQDGILFVRIAGNATEEMR